MVKLSREELATLNEISKNGVTRFVYRKLPFAKSRTHAHPDFFQRNSVSTLASQTSNEALSLSKMSISLEHRCIQALGDGQGNS